MLDRLTEKETGESDSRDEGLLGINRRSLMKAAGATTGALFGGSTLIGSAVGQTSGGECFQTDLVQNDSDDIKDPVSDTNKYNDDTNSKGSPRLISWQWGNWNDDNVNVGEDADNTGTYNQSCDVTIESDISFDYGSNQAEVTVDISNCESGVSETRLALPCYRAPCGDPNNPNFQGNTQPLFAQTQQTISESDSAQTLTVQMPGAPANVPQRSSIEAYYPFNTDDGTDYVNANDIDKSDTNGSIVTGASGVETDTNDAFDLKNVDDGSDNDGLVSSNALPINQDTATVAGWFNFDNHDSFGRVFQVGGTLSNSSGEGYDIEINDPGSGPEANLVTFPNIDKAGPISISRNNWYFFAAVVDIGNDTSRLHIFDTSGELSGSPKTTFDGRTGASNRDTSKFLHVGGGGGSYVDGRFDELYGFSTALSQSEVTSLYRASTKDDVIRNTTQDTNHVTIQGAVDAASSGDTIQVPPGTYGDNLTVNKSGVTVESTGDYTDTTISTSGGIEITDTNGKVDGFTIEKTNDDGTGLVYVSGSTTTISNCLIDGNSNVTSGGGGANNGSAAVELDADATVQKNIIENAYINLRLAAGSDGTTATDNIIRNASENAVRGEDFNGSGIQLDNSSVTGNDITDNNFGIYADDPEDDNLDATNNFFNNNEFGKSAGDVDISNEASSSVASGPSTN